MGDDWRVELEIEGHGGLRHLVDAARERAVAREARHRLDEHVLLTTDRDRLFGYTSSREEAESAARELSELAGSHNLQAHATVSRWHPQEERWHEPDVPLPTTAAETEAEREDLAADEEAHSRAWGYSQWQVRIELGRHRDAVALAERLQAEGHGVLRRSSYVLVGAASEQEAGELAERLRSELPAEAKVIAEGSEAYAWAELHRYSWLGGLGQ